MPHEKEKTRESTTNKNGGSAPFFKKKSFLRKKEVRGIFAI